MAGLVPMRPGSGGPVSLIVVGQYIQIDSSIKRSKPTTENRGPSSCSNVRQKDYLSCRRLIARRRDWPDSQHAKQELERMSASITVIRHVHSTKRPSSCPILKQILHLIYLRI